MIPRCDHDVSDVAAAALNPEKTTTLSMSIASDPQERSAVSSTKSKPVIKMAKQAPGILGSLLRRCHSLHGGIFLTSSKLWNRRVRNW